MALYVSAGTRRRRLLVAAAGALVVGVLLGAVAGRALAPTPADNAGEAKRAVAQASGLLDAVPFHYGKMMEGSETSSYAASLDDGLRRAGEQLEVALAAAPWLDPAVAADLREELVALRAVADRRAPPEELRTAVQRTVADLRLRFGLPAT
jgi:hypothetical protein